MKNQAKVTLAATKRTCNGKKETDTCFFARRLYDGEYKCGGCGVLAPHVCRTPSYRGLCIQCYFKHDDNRDYLCLHKGCKAEFADVQRRIDNGVDLSSSADAPEPEIASTGGASSSRDDQARNLLQSTQALRNDLAEIKEMLMGMQEQIVALSACPAWQQGEWKDWKEYS